MRKSHLAFYVVFAIVFGLFLFYPIWYAIRGAFVAEDEFTTAFVFGVFTDPVQFESILNSIYLGVAVTICSTLVAMPLAWCSVKYRFAGKPILTGLLLVPMILPPFVGAIGMRTIFARYYGSANLLLSKMGLIDEDSLIDWFGAWGFVGVVVLETLHLYPIMFLNLSSALANVDPSMEEAAKNMGSSGFGLFRRITFPLLLPGFFAGGTIVFIWAFTDLGTPLMFGYRNVIAVQIFDRLKEIDSNPQGYALVVVVLLTTLIMFVASKKLVRSDSYSMLSKGGKGSQETKPGPFLLVGIYGLFVATIAAAVIPHVGVVLTAFSERWFMSVTPEVYTTAHFENALSHPLTLPAIKNSILYSSLSTLLDIGIGLLIAIMLVRHKIKGAALIDGIVMLPLALPGIVLAFGYVGAFRGWEWSVGGVRLILDPRVDPTLLLICSYAVRRLPYMVRAVVAGLQQVSASFEEASMNLGAGPLETTRRITIPLIGANIVAGSILAFSFAMLEVSDSLLLAFSETYYPITKAIYQLFNRLGDGPYIASALGVWAMVFLTASLMGASILLGRKMGEMFRA